MRSLDRLAEASALLRSVEQSEELTATQRHACWHIQALVDDLASSVQTLQEMDGGLLRTDGGTEPNDQTEGPPTGWSIGDRAVDRGKTVVVDITESSYGGGVRQDSGVGRPNEPETDDDLRTDGGRSVDGTEWLTDENRSVDTEGDHS